MAKGRILVVDDEESVAITISAILELEGYTVSTAVRSADAFSLIASEEPFDVVLTDLRLDEADGAGVIGEAVKRSPETIGIIMTGYASIESAVRAIREGVYDYLIKPCDVDELKITIGRGIERHALRQELNDRMVQLEAANAEVNKLNATLQERVDSATAELRQRMEDLALANKEIERLYEEANASVETLTKLDELKSRFLSMASHELKTPLTSVSGMSQLLARRLEQRLSSEAPMGDDWRADYQAYLSRLTTIIDQTAKLSRLVDELLDVSRIESGRVQFVMQPVNLSRLAASIVDRVQLSTDKHLISLLSEDDVVLTADELHLEQVVNNLLANAIKYSPEGGSVEMRIERADESSIRVSVKDQGIGIPGDEHESVFDLFYRSAEPSRRVSGMGLGLYISKEIVSRHGGRIWVESEPGAGSTFFFSLPLTAAPVESTDPVQV